MTAAVVQEKRSLLTGTVWGMLMLLGGWLASTYGLATVMDGKPGFIPTPILFQVAGALVLLAVIPLLTIRIKKTE
jgi:hypothetical protein